MLVITLSGAAMRIHIATVEAMWRDEAQTVAIASDSFPAGIIRGLVADGNSPLFYLAEHFVVAPRDASFRELRDRAISLFFGIALMPLSFVLGRALSGGSASAGLALATWVAFAPIAIDASTQARPYSTLMFSVGLLALASIRVASANDGWGWYGLAAVCTLYLHTFAATVLAAIAIVLFFVARRGGFVRQWLLWHAGIAVAAVPALLLVVAQVRGLTHGGRIPWASDTRLSELPLHLFTLLTGVSGGAIQPLAGWMMLALFVVAMIFGTPTVRMMGGAAVLALVIAMALSLLSAGLVTRYNLPIAFLLVAVTCTIFRRVKEIAPAAFMILYTAFAITNSDYYAIGQRSASRATARLILEQSRPDDVIMIVPDTFATAVNYYLPPRFQQMDAPSLTRVRAVDFRGWDRRFSERSRIRAIDERLQKARLEGRRVWLVVWLPMMNELPPQLSGNSLLARQWSFSRDVGAVFGRHYSTPRLTRSLRAREGSAVMLGEARER